MLIRRLTMRAAAAAVLSLALLTFLSADGVSAQTAPANNDVVMVLPFENTSS